jgi:starch-binding outer membrane protein, SusD/RagB family
MKKIKYSYFLIVMLSFTIIGCDDFLTEKPVDFRSSSTSYQDEAGTYSGVLGLYQLYSDLYIHPNTPFIGELGTDESIANGNQAALAAIYRYSLTSNDLFVLPDWYAMHYKLISSCNVLIDRVTVNFPTPNASIQRMVGEAKVLRAWSYFRLVQTFGPVPLVTKEMMTEIDWKIGRAPVKDIYAQIISDLDAATVTGVLPNARDAKDPVRLSHWVAKSMLGKVYLTMASTKETGIVDDLLSKIDRSDWGYSKIPETSKELYQKAEIVLTDIKTNSGISLEPDYRKLFVAEYKNQIAENMWELQANDGKASANPNRGFGFLFNYGIAVGNNFGVVYNTIWRKNIMFAPALMLRGDQNINNQVVYVGGYEESDKRKPWILSGGRMVTDAQGVAHPQYWRALYNVGTKVFTPTEKTGKSVAIQENTWLSDTWFYTCVTKFRFYLDKPMDELTALTDVNSLPLNFTVIRYADVLLMLAEASMKANDSVATDLTADCMNMIRSRSRDDNNSLAYTELPLYDKTTLTAENILNERKLELCFENIRWFDLARTGKLLEKYNLAVPAPAQNMTTHPIITDTKHYLYPIPQSQIDVSLNKTDMFQNYGY